MRRDEVFENGETFAEGRENRTFDDFAGGLGHKTAGATELADLLLITTRAGIHHDVNRVHLGLAFVGFEFGENLFGNAVGGVGPDVDDLVVTLAVGDDTLVELGFDFGDLLARVGDNIFLRLRDDHVVDTDRDARLERGLETELLELVEGLNGHGVTGGLVGIEDEVAELSLRDREVNKTEFLRPDLVEDDTADGGAEGFLLLVTVNGVATEIRIRDFDPIVNLERAVSFDVEHFLQAAEQRHADALGWLGAGFDGEVVSAEDDVLRGREDRLAGGRREDVVRRHHEQLALEDGLEGERHVDRHLVTVEVRVVSGTDERVNANGFALDEDGLEGLDGQTVQRRRAIEQHRVTLGDFFEDVPDFRRFLLDHLAGTADGVHETEFLQAANDERLEQDERHFLGQTALAELELRTDDDDGTAGVIDAFAEQVLAETTLFALEHVAQRF